MMYSVRFVIAVLFTLPMIIAGGCGPKIILPAPTEQPLLAGNELRNCCDKDIVGGNLDSSGNMIVSPHDSADNLVPSETGSDRESKEYKTLYGRSTPPMQPVYFHFDKSSIRTDQILRFEANCDERSTNEYNLALGERRAQNAKKYLVKLGVEEHRIRTVSYGEERPLFTGKDEISWSQNRRDDFVLEY